MRDYQNNITILPNIVTHPNNPKPIFALYFVRNYTSKAID